LDEDSLSRIVNHINGFVSQSRGNESVEDLCLRPHACNGHDDAVWEIIGQAIDNLHALERLNICNYKDHYDNDDDDDDDDQVI
jgi:hypothetical protein